MNVIGNLHSLLKFARWKRNTITEFDINSTFHFNSFHISSTKNISIDVIEYSIWDICVGFPYFNSKISIETIEMLFHFSILFNLNKKISQELPHTYKEVHLCNYSRKLDWRNHKCLHRLTFMLYTLL